MFIDVLAIMCEDQAKLLLVRNGFGEGIQAHFFYHWKMWKTAQMQNEPCQTTSIIDAPKTFTPSEHQRTEINTAKIEPAQNVESDAITLTKIFDWAGKMAKTLMDSYAKNDIFSETERAKLCDVIINYCVYNNFKLNVCTCRTLAEEIVIAFPNEIETTYHKPTNGRLICKYNYKQRQAGKDSASTEKRPESPSSCSNKGKKMRIAVDNADMMKAISKLNNDPSLTADEIKNLWIYTARYRIDFIAKNGSSNRAVYAKWEQYREPLGYVYVCKYVLFHFNFASHIPFYISISLQQIYFFSYIYKIDIDFAEMYGEMDDMLLHMGEFLACFIDYLTDEHRGFKNEKCKEMWDKYDNDMSECKLFDYGKIDNLSH